MIAGDGAEPYLMPVIGTSSFASTYNHFFILTNQEGVTNSPILLTKKLKHTGGWTAL
jgi:hypothetical protein